LIPFNDIVSVIDIFLIGKMSAVPELKQKKIARDAAASKAAAAALIVAKKVKFEPLKIMSSDIMIYLRNINGVYI
jgi:hypothetical protein